MPVAIVRRPASLIQYDRVIGQPVAPHQGDGGGGGGAKNRTERFHDGDVGVRENGGGRRRIGEPARSVDSDGGDGGGVGHRDLDENLDRRRHDRHIDRRDGHAGLRGERLRNLLLRGVVVAASPPPNSVLMSCDGGGGGGGATAKAAATAAATAKARAAAAAAAIYRRRRRRRRLGEHRSRPRPAARASAIGSKVEVQAHRSVTVPSIVPTTSAINPPSRTVASISIEPMRALDAEELERFLQSRGRRVEPPAAVLNCGAPPPTRHRRHEST